MVFKVSEIRDCITLQFRDAGTFLVPVATKQRPIVPALLAPALRRPARHRARSG